MAIFVLVHGAWHGAWCWNELVPRLESLGHRALAIDLPGHGEDPTPAERVVFGDYTATVIAAARSADYPPVLVGHSMAA